MAETQKTKPISNFHYEYAFLSNFFDPAPVELDGVWYPNIECAYQAAKTLDLKLREPFTKYQAGKAKSEGQNLPLRENWDGIKNDVMLDLLRKKFSNPGLRLKLLATGDAELIEGNWWHDMWFGVCNGRCKEGPHNPSGLNWLGKLLMQVRTELENSNGCSQGNKQTI
jgi:ribA/ribD-fused uncharacterized protein